MIKNLILLSDRNGFVLYDRNSKIYFNNRILKETLKWYDTCFIVGNNNIQSNKILDIFKCPNEFITEGLFQSIS